MRTRNGNGVMEHWSTAVLKKNGSFWAKYPITPLLHYSIHPHSIPD
jgi:hypothetical protein